MAESLYFYKLVSPYFDSDGKPIDHTLNCKLNVNQIDGNFLTLKDYDIKSAELDEETYSVVLTRNNGDRLVVDLTTILSGAVYDLEISYENPTGDCKGATIYVTYTILGEDDVKRTFTVPITGLVTTDNLNSLLGERHVITDGSLTGYGTMDSPLGISATEKIRPAIELIDTTSGYTLPETAKIGDRYITKEYVSEFGYLYNYHGVEKIAETLEREGRGWRIPTKADWDCLLNSIEPCDYRNHDSALCHQVLGKYAGTKLKSACGWLEQPDCECKVTRPFSGQYCGDDESGNTESGMSGNEEFDEDTAIDPNDAEPTPVRPDYWGVDEYGMRILPTGYGDGDEVEYYFNKKTVFWTSTHVYNDVGQDYYVKEFDWNKSGVVQEAQCPDALFSLRHVKDYTGGNHFETETIDGLNYDTKLFADCGLIWTASNFAGTKESYSAHTANMGLNPYNRIAYFINVWNGKEWEKRSLEEGESVVIMEGNEHCQYNIEYRVYTSDDCNQILINVDDIVVERVLERILPIIDREREERISADTEIWEALRKEIQDRIDADEQEKEEREAADQILQEEIDAEVARAQDVEQQLWDAINTESERAQSVEQDLWHAIEEEASARTEVDNQLWDAIAQEASARTDVDSQLWDAINGETERAQEVEADLWDAINAEASARTDVDNQLWEAIINEAETRERVDNEQWEAINNEIERAKSEEERIECQIIDNPAEPQNENIPEGAINDGAYVLNLNGGMTLYSKCGTNDIPLKINADFGTF